MCSGGAAIVVTQLRPECTDEDLEWVDSMWTDNGNSSRSAAKVALQRRTTLSGNECYPGSLARWLLVEDAVDNGASLLAASANTCRAARAVVQNDRCAAGRSSCLGAREKRDVGSR